MGVVRMTSRGHKHEKWIKIQELSKPVFEFDPTPAAWVDKYILRAHVGTSQGDESVSSQRTEATRRIPVTFRWVPGVSEEMRILIDDETIPLDENKRTLHISSVDNIGDRNLDLELDCTELRR